MANNYIQDGDVLDFTATGTVTAGSPILVGTKLGVPLKSGVSGEVVPLAMEGVFLLPKATGAGTALVVGGVVYWDDSAKKVTGVASGNTAIGYAFEAAGTSAATAKVKIMG